MSDIKPFQVEISDEELTSLKTKLANTRFPEAETPDDWSQGVPLAYVRELAEYWEKDYDLRRVETRLNTHPQFHAELDGLNIHFLHIRSPEENALPLVMTHGWPGSVVEFLKVIEPLTDPVNHGGDAGESFHVICPALPGYGYSDKPTQPGWGVEKIAEEWANLMARLGYERYVAQGGDWGAAVTTMIGIQDTEHCSAIHLNMPTVRPDPETMDNLTELEQQAMAGLKYYRDWDSGYSKEQSTRPQTVGYGLVDSPVGQAAWIIEKFWAWMDCDGHPENVLTRDELLDNVMMYWLTASGASSGRLYWESFGGGGQADEVTVPTGCSIFPKEIFRCSKRWAEKRFTNLIYWNELDKGGHFAAFEQPELFVNEVRNCFKSIR
ncbi:MAG: epoxide hydrolase [Gammaproteobacteria bacterium]|nr:epoxide hydrolase [Gammaproteobacteria bacterium]